MGRSHAGSSATQQRHRDTRTHQARASAAEKLLRGLAANDDRAVRSVLCPERVRLVGSDPRPAVTPALVRLAALLAGGGCTTSLRWATELALDAGAEAAEIVEVLATIGASRVVASASFEGRGYQARQP